VCKGFICTEVEFKIEGILFHSFKYARTSPHVTDNRFNFLSGGEIADNSTQRRLDISVRDVFFHHRK